MSPETTMIVRGPGGLHGTLEPLDRPSQGATTRVVRLDDGRRVVIPAELLIARDDGGYDLPLDRAKLDRLVAGAETAIPRVAEEIDVQKRRVETGRVRATKVVRERQEVVDEPLARDEVDVQRVAVNRVVAGSVGTRQEGDTLIIPLLEEVLVVEKRLLVREELRITTGAPSTTSPRS